MRTINFQRLFSSIWILLMIISIIFVVILENPSIKTFGKGRLLSNVFVIEFILLTVMLILTIILTTHSKSNDITKQNVADPIDKQIAGIPFMEKYKSIIRLSIFNIYFWLSFFIFNILSTVFTETCYGPACFGGAFLYGIPWLISGIIAIVFSLIFARKLLNLLIDINETHTG